MEKYKYPRTYHFPFSKGASDDDKILKDENILKGKEVVITVKMDGENTTIYPDGSFHARSIDSKHKDYHSYMANIANNVSFLIPEGYRICGEYLYAKHSIYYDNLESYFLVFGIYDENNMCLSWDDTKKMCNELGLITVPVLYEGKYEEDVVKMLALDAENDGQEGIVVRNAGSFPYEEFNKNVGKYVREGHVQTDKHWTSMQIVPNKLKEKHIENNSEER